MVTVGTYRVSGVQITMSDPFCKDYGDQESATYIWSWSDGILSMTTAQDECPGRPESLAEMAPAK